MATLARYALGLGWVGAMGMAGCVGQPPDVVLDFRPEVAVAGDEAYSCFGFSVSPALLANGIESIEWRPSSGGVVMHHAKLYALPSAYPAAGVPCDQQPAGAVPIHVWAPGGAPLRMPAGVSVALPPGTQSLVVEAHVFRLAEGEATTQSLSLTAAEPTAKVRAGWTARSGVVPALRPGHVESSTDRCVMDSALHVYVAWGHEHLLGREFRATAARSGVSGALTLVDVPVWTFAAQVATSVDSDLLPGDVFEMTCTWLNDTDHYVLPGPRTTDEMCGLGMIVSPAPGASLPCSPGT